MSETAFGTTARTSPAARREVGFSLIELLVVISVIMLLAALLLPVFSVARNAARQVADMSNLGQIGKAIVNYTSEGNRLPDARCMWPGVTHLYPTLGGMTTGPGMDPRKEPRSLQNLLRPYLNERRVWVNPNAVCGLTADGDVTRDRAAMVQSYVVYARDYSARAYGRESSYLHSRFDNLDGGPVARRTHKKFWLRNAWAANQPPPTGDFEAPHAPWAKRPGVHLLYNDGHVFFSEGHRPSVSTPW